MVSMRMSSGRISISTSSASGSTATVAAEVWMRPLRLGRRHPLHPVHAGFEFEPGEHASARHRGDDLLEAAGLALACRDHLHPPALRWRRSAGTCGRGRRRTAPPRRRRCRRGFPGWRCCSSAASLGSSRSWIADSSASIRSSTAGRSASASALMSRSVAGSAIIASRSRRSPSAARSARTWMATSWSSEYSEAMRDIVFRAGAGRPSALRACRNASRPASMSLARQIDHAAKAGCCRVSAKPTQIGADVACGVWRRASEVSSIAVRLAERQLGKHRLDRADRGRRHRKRAVADAEQGHAPRAACRPVRRTG